MNETCPACSQRKKQRSEEEKKALMNRLSRIEGQIRGLRGMLEKDAYCTDILTQATAAEAALKSFSREMLSTHIRTCVAEDLRAGHDEAAEDLIATLVKMLQ